MPRRNRVDPWSDLHAAGGRGMFTGNRGCLVDDAGNVVRHHGSQLWITCVTEFRDWRHPLAAPRRWTPIFFLDDAVALAAGHRPCGLCRRDDYLSYQRGVTVGLASDTPVPAHDLNRRLAAERLNRGRGVARATDRKTWRANVTGLPDGTAIVEAGEAFLLWQERKWSFDFSGWIPSTSISSGEVEVLTPPTSVLALSHGFAPRLHHSIAARA